MIGLIALGLLVAGGAYLYFRNKSKVDAVVEDVKKDVEAVKTDIEK